MVKPSRERLSGADLKIRAAWLYFIEGLTQAEIADTLGINRPRVIRLIAQARAEGTVRIEIGDVAASLVECERLLLKRHGLKAAIVVPDASSALGAASHVGFAAGQWLSESMRDGMSVAVGWGNTLNLALRGITGRPCQRCSVVSLMGGMTHSRAINPSAVARRIADLFAADCYQLTAPVFVSAPAMREQLMREPGLQDLVRRAESADLALVSVGEVDEGSTLVREGLLTARECADLREKGAVGDVICRFIDAAGNEVDDAVNRRAMSAGLDVLKAIPCVAIASGGRTKAQAIRAAMKATQAQVLITDEGAARALIAMPG